MTHNNTVTADSGHLMTVRYGGLAPHRLFLWIGWTNLIVAAVGVIIEIIAIWSGGLLAGLIVAPVTGPIIIVGLISRRGIPLPELIWRRVSWRNRKVRGRTSYRKRPEEPVHAELTRAGRLDLPGRGKTIQIMELNGGTAVVFDQAAQTVSVTARVASSGLDNLSPAEVNSRIGAWAAVMSSWTLRDGIARFTQTERVARGSVAAAADYASEHASAPTEGLQRVAESYEESLSRADAAARTMTTLMTMTFNAHELRDRIRQYGGGQKGLAAVITLELDTVHASFVSAGFTEIEWLRPDEIRGSLRAVADPAFEEAIFERAAQSYEQVSPGGEALMLLDDEETYVHTDSGYHRVFWIHEWPRTDTYPGFLRALIFGSMPDGSPLRHILTIVSAPVQLREALKRIRKAKENWEANDMSRAKRGRPQTALAVQEYQNLIEQEEALVQGMGEYRFSAYLMVSADSLEELEQSAAAAQQLLAHCGLEPALLGGQQYEAYLTVLIPTGTGLK